MESKFFIFVVSATVILMQSLCTNQQSPSVYGLSAEKSRNFHGIINTQKLALSSSFGGINPVFDVLETLSLQRKFNLQGVSLNFTTLIADSFAKARSASDYTFNTIPVILGIPCSAAESARLLAHEDLENIYTQIGNAIGLSQSGVNAFIQTEFQPFWVSAKGSLAVFTTKFFAALRTCVNITNPETITAIKYQENISLENIHRVSDAIFDAIKVFASGIYSESSAGAPAIAAPSIEEYRQRALFNMKNTVEHSYISLRGLYVSMQLNKPELAASFIADQYAQILSASKYEASVGLIFDIIKSHLNKVKLGLSDGCHVDSVSIDAAQEKTRQFYKDGFHALFGSVLPRDANSSATTQTNLEFLDDFSNTAAVAYFSGIRFALEQGSTYDETITKILNSKTTFWAKITNFVRTIFDALRLEGSDDVEIRNITLQAGRTFLDNIFNSAETLAKACHGVKAVTEEDFVTLEDARNGATSAAGKFTSEISSGHAAVINTIPAINPTVPSVV